MNRNALILMLVHSTKADYYVIEDLRVSSFFVFIEDETGGCSGTPSMGMCTSENETLDFKSNHEFGDSQVSANKGKCIQP